MIFTRRQLLKTGAAWFTALGFGRVTLAEAAKPVTGKILGASAKIGHQLRGGSFPAPSSTTEKETVIIGGGIAGLAAGYRLHKENADFTLLELEPDTGGNAQSGKNNVSAYPWGAHYVPLLTDESKAVRKLFRDFGIITGDDEKGRAIYNEYYLCSDPHERLYMFGRWQEGLLPQTGATDEDRRQYDAFFKHLEGLRGVRGKDGKKLFAIPVDDSSQDADWLALDNITMREWMVREGYTSKYLQWHVDYGCRDDYGVTLDDTSAWAGIHYFAGRSGVAANTDDSNFVTWPEGNGFLAKKLAEPLAGNITTQALVFAVRREGEGVTVDYLDQKTGAAHRISARSVIMATPQFVSARLLPEVSAENFSYAPWAVANITLDRLPEGAGAELSWDNVVYDSKLLGYVVATHQGLAARPMRTVLTYYWPLSHAAPKQAREEALARKYEEWRDIFLGELLAVHPELKGFVKSLDVWIWGHAMVRPVKGFMWGDARRNTLKQSPPVFYAHSDMSGISIFEEAYIHGVRAAENALKHLDRKFESEL
jgi:hypothetical protein